MKRSNERSKLLHATVIHKVSFKYTEFNYKAQKRPIKFKKTPSSKKPSYTLCNTLIFLLAIKILQNCKANVSNNQL